MAQYIDKDALIAWALEELKLAEKFYKETESDVYFGKINLLKKQLSFLNTLEVKEIDFEREMQAFAKINLEPLVISDSNIGISITMSQLYDCAKHFYSLGLKAQKGE